MTDFAGGGERSQILARATEEALAVRGTVMLEAADEARRWCAVCASVQGDLEVRVAEPPRGWRRWKAAPGEAWLARNEFTHRIDAWTRSLRPGVSARECAAVLDDALSRALGLAPATTLRRSLVVPGVLPGTAAAPGEAAYPEHLASALRGLVAAGDGSVHVESGRPARPLAWVWLVDGMLIVEIEARDVPGTEVEVGRFPPSPDGAADAASALSERLERDFACAQPVPLFIGCLATAPER
jgi:hypothetical protein